MNNKIIVSVIFLVLLIVASYAEASPYKDYKEDSYAINESKQLKNNTSSNSQNSNLNSVSDDNANKEDNDNNSKAELKTILDNSTVNNLDDLSKSELLKKEVQKLNQDLDSLNTKVDNLEKENSQLKLNLQKYGDEEKRKLQKDEQVEILSEEARNAKASTGDNNVPDAYISAQNLLIIGNIDLAEQQFKAFIEKASTDKKSNEYLGSTSAAGLFIAYANYWLGKINNINGDYRKATEYFSESYKITNYSNLSLMSLVGLIESLTRLSKDTEACTAIKQFRQDYSKAATSKSFNFNARYLKMVDNFKAINRCQ